MQISREKDIDTLVYAIKKVRRAVLRNTVDGELGIRKLSLMAF